MFRAADLVLITKMDLAPALDDFDLARVTACVHRVQPKAEVIPCSARTGAGLDRWFAWLAAEAARRNGGAEGAHAR
jgi:hydrogenase nickel incorporation protein HypB